MPARFMFCGQSQSRFKIDGWFSRLRFDHQRDFVFGGAFGLQRRGFGMFGNFGRQNVRPFIGRALFNGGGQVFGFGVRFCGQAFELALGRAVPIECAGVFVRSFGQSVSRY